jgi:integrase
MRPPRPGPEAAGIAQLPFARAVRGPSTVWNSARKATSGGGSVPLLIDDYREGLDCIRSDPAYHCDHEPASISPRPCGQRRGPCEAIAGDGGSARNVILEESEVRSVIAAAYRQSDELGLYVELMAVTGARPSQLERLRGEDVQLSGKPRVMMPASRKGRGGKAIAPRPSIRAAITESLARKLKGRTGPLLLQPDGSPWTTCVRGTRFADAVDDAGLDPSEVTLYALRHTSIVRQLKANVPIRVVAALHDTSVAMIEKNYSKYITDHVDDLARQTLLETAEIIPFPSEGKSS